MEPTEPNSTCPRPAASRRVRRVGAVAFLCLSAGVFSLLIWAKLRVVTGIPRTAYADPDSVAASNRRAPSKSPAAQPAHPAPAKPDPAHPQ